MTKIRNFFADQLGLFVFCLLASLFFQDALITTIYLALCGFSTGSLIARALENWVSE